VIEVTIDELTVHGLDPRGGAAFLDALRGELEGALAGWRPARTRGRDALDLGTVTVPIGAAPAHVGHAVGARIARALRDADAHVGQVVR
jgi:hypothetical protein